MKRILSLVVVALVMAAILLVMAMPALADAEDNDADETKCSEATLEGRYLFSFDGYEIKGNKKVPFSQAGYEVYDGNGHVEGVYSGNLGGEVIRNQPLSGTYTVKADCTGTVTYTDGTQVDQFFSPDGSEVAFVLVKPPAFVGGGLEVRGTKTRVGD
jgi:hypothetical protein